MKFIRVLLIALLLTLQGCFYQSVNNNDWRKAEIVCKNNGGIQEVTSHWAGSERVYCKNNMNKSLDGTIIDDKQ